MLALAWANLTHHKLRTLLSALAVGIGIMLMLVSKGLARGSISEVGQRMQSVDAELIVIPAQDNIIFTNGAPFRRIHEKHLGKLADENGPLATEVIPVFFGQVKMGGQQQRLFGVDPAQMASFKANRKLIAGKLFDRAHDFAKRVHNGARPPEVEDLANQAYRDFIDDGLELVIDERLQQVGNYKIGETVPIMGQTFRIVGVIEAGVAGRVFAPLPTMREIVVTGQRNASMYFLRLRRDVDPKTAIPQFKDAFSDDVRIELKSDYGHLLREAFASVDMYMTASSGVALAACFLFILLTMYTMVIQHVREIAILKSLGVTSIGLLRLAVIEALLISLAGVAIGIALSFGVRGLIAAVKPLLTVDLAWPQLAAAIAVGVIGGTVSALYPGYRAARTDPAVTLSNE